MNIMKSTDRFEDWLRQELGADLVSADLDKKREKMKDDPFAFLRATFWRWAEVIPDLIGDAGEAPFVLAVGDIHLENYGTWRDAEGRLVWGVNDFDEAARMPYTLDLVRLATSALLARGHGLDDPDSVTVPLLEGYAEGLANPSAFILDGGDDDRGATQRWLRKHMVVSEDQRKDFWSGLEDDRKKHEGDGQQKRSESARIPPRLEHMLRASLPVGAQAPDIWYRRSGLGSLGRPRWVARSAWHGGWVVREVKAVVPSAWSRVDQTSGRAIRCMEIATGRYRCPDPWYRVVDSIVVRRLSPNNRKIEATTKKHKGSAKRRNSLRLPPSELLHETMLGAMGRDLAAIHLGAGDRGGGVGDDFKRRAALDPHWLECATARSAEFFHQEWNDYQASAD
jgi:uncharacterized protein (DUF2252 family)